MPALTWAPRARVDLRRIDAWLEREASPDVAFRTLFAITARSQQLVEFPHSGRMVPKRGFRVLPVIGTRYLLAYRVVAGAAEILRVYHERQNWHDPD